MYASGKIFVILMINFFWGEGGVGGVLRLCSLEFLVLKCSFKSVCLNRLVMNVVSFSIYLMTAYFFLCLFL